MQIDESGTLRMLVLLVVLSDRDFAKGLGQQLAWTFSKWLGAVTTTRPAVNYFSLSKYVPPCSSSPCLRLLFLMRKGGEMQGSGLVKHCLEWQPKSESSSGLQSVKYCRSSWLQDRFFNIIDVAANSAHADSDWGVLFFIVRITLLDGSRSWRGSLAQLYVLTTSLPRIKVKGQHRGGLLDVFRQVMFSTSHRDLQFFFCNLNSDLFPSIHQGPFPWTKLLWFSWLSMEHLVSGLSFAKQKSKLMTWAPGHIAFFFHSPDSP